jgi:pimeloyl-ACP methyl ester carboxylesterase
MHQPPKWIALCVVLLISLARPAVSEGAAWKDPSPHRISFVTVEPGVKLEVLDWGGSGRPALLLAGGGNTAHIFDGFAPKLAAQYHVYGVTRRGFGASGYAPSDDLSKRLGEDVLAVIDSLNLSRPVLIGHSAGGAELSWVANNHPNRVAGLIYLDAGYFYAFDNGKGFEFADMEALHPPQMPPPDSSELATFSAMMKYCGRMEGFLCVEAELRQQWEAKPDGTVGAKRQSPGNSMLMKLIKSSTKYNTIPVPALFIFANPHTLGPWVENSPDPSVRSAAKAYYAGLESLTTKQENAIKSGLPGARVVNLPNADHFVFLSHEADVLREIGAFVGGLQERTHL